MRPNLTAHEVPFGWEKTSVHYRIERCGWWNDYVWEEYQAGFEPESKEVGLAYIAEQERRHPQESLRLVEYTITVKVIERDND